ncbi:phosphatidylinositol 3-kinase [Naegleria gruberi]|uniref:phosphatidylinositol 3-kinase n=1 Tax=Naegleria gruberi TaxID=5762 RepID=D2V6J3_NAEGR|nr:phosphatidylinositol 3-kinase [Naegleria gruberi]EFC47585.1 phosphatidylinositol 3-kinase [Naegleria gruberi]|eukprot:XP_002680329.1 phosphatidylinositol 3-kinase [Naegleria gruberi strain NEG-M]
MLEAIVKKSPLQEISVDEKTLLWRYRKFLQSEKRIGTKALTKFLRSVDWSIDREAKEAASLMQGWTKIDIPDALFLLSKYFKGVDSVRNHAVNVLKDAPEQDILSVLLQLVQALRYEHDMRTCKLADLLIEKAERSLMVSNDLYWYLTIACEDSIMGEFYYSYRARVLENYKTKKQHETVKMLQRQTKMVQNLSEICLFGKTNRNSTEIVKEKFREIAERKVSSWDGIFEDNSSLILPLDPRVSVNNVDPTGVTIFSSNARPMKLAFKTSPKSTYHAIFKIGDDLRQDQLIIQIINTMDTILKDNGMDLKLTPYRVLACGKQEGFLECVLPSTPFAKIIEKQSIEEWLKDQNKNKSHQEMNEVLDNFMKSCAGYCVITYILGIGDRHLDNILLTPDGKLFHIDFGFILGHDPKPYPPPMKLCADMVLGMGGSGSERYKSFIKNCCSAYNILRQHSRMILNLFILMIDAGIPNIDHGISRDSKIGEQLLNILTVQQRLCLELTEEEAIQFMRSVITDSERTLFAVHDIMHRFAGYWK